MDGRREEEDRKRNALAREKKKTPKKDEGNKLKQRGVGRPLFEKMCLTIARHGSVLGIKAEHFC